MFQRLELTPRPPMGQRGTPQEALYLEAVTRAGNELRAAEPWMLLAYEPGDYWVAARRTLAMLVVVWLVNLWRRPRRWYLGRLKLARERRFFLKGNRN